MDLQQLSALRISGVYRFEQPLHDAPALQTVPKDGRTFRVELTRGF
jgi:hypothetical protein